jgi:hypothetical protein
MIEMKVKALMVGQDGDLSILLTDAEEKKVLPIVIGALEAHSIALPLQGEIPPRPMTHDLLKSVLQRLGGQLDKILITDIKDSTYFAELYVEYNDQTLVIDSRPSDAIALALRCKVPIFMATRLVEFTYDYEDIVFNSEGEQGTH